ncbi:hypothetical protein QA600_04770 [Natronococcus sp. A-GB1]|uniref:hypothetical protein n=1 Tax=Natronococcus sp. A-GB1 TaxID=3037648 RepID=UPI00241E3F4F|nr:hypothetical protein [Natronococcus sp. A-GB1]MDG5758648.1 hypothetical protein [Natronococcus sp. A-GB1]
MSDDTEAPPSVSEFVEYCHTQAGLLSGRVETMTNEANELLDEIDERLAELRSELEERSTDTPRTERPPSATGPVDGTDVDDLEAAGRDLEEKQALVDAKQARIQAFQELSAGYTELAADLQTEVDEGQEALNRIVEFEAEADAPAYFDERETLCEIALEASEDE